MNDINLTLQNLRCAQSTPAVRPGKLVLLLRHDLLYAMDLALQLYAYGFTVMIADDLQALIDMAARKRPDCVLIDLPFNEAAMSPAEIGRIHAASGRHVPVLMLSARNHFEARLSAARAGADGYVVKPVDSSRLADRLEALTTFADAQGRRVMIVCSHAERSAHYQGLLTAAGMDGLCSKRPSDMLRMLEQHRPDALLVDVDSPAVTAADLIALVRQDSSFSDIPVVVVAGDDEPSVRQSAIRSGVDHVVSRSAASEDLVLALESRIERYRHLRGLIMRDRLTGLYNHTAFKEELQRELARARRNLRPLAYAMLDLDFFKKINDTHGHPVGDQVLRSMARLMRQRLRHGDVIGRYGGEEFGVILPETTGTDAVAVLDEVRTAFQNIRHMGRYGEFSATVTTGVVEFVPDFKDCDSMTLIRLADAALYRGKHAGRNRVELARPSGEEAE